MYYIINLLTEVNCLFDGIVPTPAQKLQLSIVMVDNCQNEACIIMVLLALVNNGIICGCSSL